MTAASDALRAALDAAVADGVALQAPGVHDAVTAKLAAAAGFRALHLSGAVASAVRLGLPDLGYLHGTDVAAVAAVVCAATDVPVVADADTGYGNPLHARRTVEQYAAAGLAGLHLEDQVSPKRCGHMAGKSVIDRDEAVQKVRAAVEAGTGLVVIARTDALSVLGIDEAVERARAFCEAGADLVFVEGASSAEQLDLLHAALPDARLVVNVSEADPTLRPLPPSELGARGVALALYPVAPLLAAARAAAATYTAIASQGDATSVDRMTWDDLTDLLGLPALLDLETRYS